MFELTPFEGKHNDLFKKFFDSDWGLPAFRTDIRDEGKQLVLEAELPGFEKDDIRIDIQDNYLTISAERTQESGDKDQNGNYLRRERSYGRFQRSFDISNIDKEKIKASYRHGLLSLSMPKRAADEFKSKRVEIE